MNTSAPLHHYRGIPPTTPYRSNTSATQSATPVRQRGPGPMVTNSAQTPHQPPTQAQLQHQQQVAQQERELAKRRSRKPTDKTIPEAVEELVPNAALYRNLREIERRYDATIMRKRLDIQDAVNSKVKTYRTLRIWISNTAKDQPWQNSDRPLDENAFDFETGQIPTFRVRIEGRLLDEGKEENSEDEDEEEAQKEPSGAGDQNGKKKEMAPNQPPRKFSSFFRSIVVELERDNSLYPEGNLVEWRRAPGAPLPPQPGQPPQPPPAPQQEFDGFEFERKGDIDINCTIKLERLEIPDKYRLSPQLADLLDTKEDTRAGIVMGLWEYVRIYGLQDPDERRAINCDAALKAIFNTDRLYFPNIPELTVPHLQPIAPIVIPYTIRVSTASHQSPVAYDISIPIEDPIRAQMQHILQSPSYNNSLRELAMLDDQLANIVQAINHSKAKRDFWYNMAGDPAGFINRWISSQRRDMEIILGEEPGRSVIGGEEVRRSAFFNAQEGLDERMVEIVHLLLARKAQEQVTLASQGSGAGQGQPQQA